MWWSCGTFRPGAKSSLQQRWSPAFHSLLEAWPCFPAVQDMTADKPFAALESSVARRGDVISGCSFYSFGVPVQSIAWWGVECRQEVSLVDSLSLTKPRKGGGWNLPNLVLLLAFGQSPAGARTQWCHWEVGNVLLLSLFSETPLKEVSCVWEKPASLWLINSHRLSEKQPQTFLVQPAHFTDEDWGSESGSNSHIVMNSRTGTWKTQATALDLQSHDLWG